MRSRKRSIPALTPHHGFVALAPLPSSLLRTYAERHDKRQQRKFHGGCRMSEVSSYQQANTFPEQYVGSDGQRYVRPYRLVSRNPPTREDFLPASAFADAPDDDLAAARIWIRTPFTDLCSASRPLRSRPLPAAAPGLTPTPPRGTLLVSGQGALRFVAFPLHPCAACTAVR